MRKLNVDVFTDKSRPEGGHAVIRLSGLETLPDALTFRLRPVDSAHHGDAGAFAEDHHPMVTRMTEEGAELVVGPDIVENPIFLPGTLTAIEIQTCGVRGEFLWPRIPPLQRPKRRHLLGAKVVREQRADSTDVVAFDEAIDASSELTPAHKIQVSASAQSIAVGMPVPAQEGNLGPAETNKPIVPSPANDPGDPDPATAKIAAAATAPAPSASASGDATPRYIVDAAAHRPRAMRRRWPVVAAIAGVAALATFGLPRLATFIASSPAAAHRESDLVALLSVGTTSPRGVRTRDRSPTELLEAADHLLHAAGAGRDKAEAAFMLRRYLATTLGDERTLLVLTQLGSIYAEPDGARAPDYARARQLWEISATLGDPVAMCFLASLHEHGLGVAANKPAALQWYLRAKDVGGCQRIDESIARLRK